MIEFLITKYNPQNRIEGKYTAHEWTSISDIGKLFDDGVLTYSRYKQVERRYIACCIELLQKAGISELVVSSPEYYDEGLFLPSVLSTEREIQETIMNCLQEKCWAKLENRNFFIHFGYDYNMYVGTNLSVTVVQETSKKHSLFCEVKSSPYSIEDSDEI